MLSSSASSVTALRAGADLDDDGRIKKAGRSLLQQPGELDDVHPDRGVSPRAAVGGGAQGGAREHERRGAPSRHPAQVLSWAELPSRCARMVPAGARRSRPSAPRERIRALSLVCSYVGSRATPHLLPACCSCHRVQNGAVRRRAARSGDGGGGAGGGGGTTPAQAPAGQAASKLL